ncbi:hypothetical protein DFAR_160011 [Desulfarculales bacterium]
MAKLHTITKFQGDSKPTLLTTLVGQDNLADLLI